MSEQREQLSKLINKYENLTAVERRKYNEANTRKNFILPLFETLGWDTRGDDVVEEERASGKRVDYAFKINGITRFFLEAKPLSANLDEIRWAEQAIWYAYHKSVPWVVLTDFESIKVFNAEWDEQDVERSLVFEISYKDYLVSDELRFLSRLSIEKGELDEYAEREFKKPKRVGVDKQLVADLLRWRDKLYADFSGHNPLINKKKIAENVQKVLNRIIFIRTCEDRGLEERSLQEMVRNYEEGRSKSDDLVNGLRVLFREFDKNYDSKLFEERILFESEKFIADDNILAEVIQETYKGSKGIRWNFNDINGDVLGSIYEQYLGQIQREDGKEKKSSKRKSQGIYYTPRYIVDYIVGNTLGEVLKNKPAHEASKIKVLDPACGSGSFLIKAFEVLDNHIRQEWNQKGDDWLINHARKFNILTSNIYGVDLDPEAVEIAQLNLLIKALEKRERLPNLSHNIERGNSLISGTETELKKYFGKNWKDKKPFNYEEEFSDVFKQGGFDVIIGNPPYIRNRDLNESDKEFFSNKFSTTYGQYDIYQLFFEQSINLLKNGGYLGFITSNKYAIADYGKRLREFILDNCKIISIVDVSNLDVFKDASTYPYIIILQKNRNNKGNLLKGYKPINASKLLEAELQINQDDISKDDNKNFVIKEEIDFFSKIEKKSVGLGQIATIKEAIHTGNIRDKLIVNKKLDENCKKLLAGKDCHRYWSKWNNKYIRYDEKLVIKDKGEYANLPAVQYFEKPKILLREIAPNIECCYDEEKYYALNKIYSIQVSDGYNLKYILAVLNSKLLSFYFRSKFEEAHVRGGYLQFKKIYTSQLPIYKIDFSDKKEKQKHDELVKLADKMLKLNKDLQKLDPLLDEDEYKELKSEIDKTDKEIDEKVYKLYGLTEKEIGIVENNK